MADQIKRREEMKVRDLKYWEERRDRKISQYYLKLLGHGDRPVEELIQLTEEDEAKGAVRKKTHVDVSMRTISSVHHIQMLKLLYWKPAGHGSI